MYYGPSIILESGIKLKAFENENKLAIILNIPLATINALGSIIAVFFIDRLGRRYIMLRCLPGVVISLLLISVGMYN